MSFTAYLLCVVGFCAKPDSEQLTTVDSDVPIIVQTPTPTFTLKPFEIKHNLPKRCDRLLKYFLDAENPSLWAAQIWQESRCNQYAKSPFANGVAQITPATGKGLAKGDCSHMGPYRKFDDNWQMTCGLLLEEKNERYAARKFPELNYCQMKAMGQKIYNGGYWAVWEYQYAGSLVKAQQICGKVKLLNGRKRALWACDENYKYPDYVQKHQSIFDDLGGESCS